VCPVLWKFSAAARLSVDRVCVVCSQLTASHSCVRRCVGAAAAPLGVRSVFQLSAFTIFSIQITGMFTGSLGVSPRVRLSSETECVSGDCAARVARGGREG
jgi:hypothetical protein